MIASMLPYRAEEMGELVLSSPESFPIYFYSISGFLPIKYIHPCGRQVSGFAKVQMSNSLSYKKWT